MTKLCSDGQISLVCKRLLANSYLRRPAEAYLKLRSTLTAHLKDLRQDETFLRQKPAA